MKGRRVHRAGVLVAAGGHCPLKALRGWEADEEQRKKEFQPGHKPSRDQFFGFKVAQQKEKKDVFADSPIFSFCLSTLLTFLS